MRSKRRSESTQSPTTPETFIERIRETYPFHPSIRDIVARFSENRGYQKTRALIRLLRLAVRSAFASNANVFLIGLQHLDFNDQGTIEEIRKINPAYTNAISRDVADRGNALAERIDAAEGETTASAVAKVLLMSSLSAAETPLRGLTDGELIETLVDPLLEVSEIKAALGRLQGQAWYLFQGIDQRVFFGQTANVTAEITEIASNIADEHVLQTLRDKLQEVFKPRTGALYSDKMAILPALDEIQLDDDRPTLVILERAADRLPQDFVDWWNQPGPPEPGPGADRRPERSQDIARRARGGCARLRKSRSGSRRSMGRHRRKCRSFKALKDARRRASRAHFARPLRP